MRRIAAFVIALSFSLSASAAGNGWFGFSIGVDVSFLMNLESATINHVSKPSPADRAGIAVGDAIVEVEGCKIPGCGAYKAKHLLEKGVGETVALKLRRPNGEEYAATLTAESEPTPAHK